MMAVAERMWLAADGESLVFMSSMYVQLEFDVYFS